MLFTKGSLGCFGYSISRPPPTWTNCFDHGNFNFILHRYLVHNWEPDPGHLTTCYTKNTTQQAVFACSTSLPQIRLFKLTNISTNCSNCNPFFHMTVQLTFKHHHTNSGYKRFRRYFPDKAETGGFQHTTTTLPFHGWYKPSKTMRQKVKLTAGCADWKGAAAAWK